MNTWVVQKSDTPILILQYLRQMYIDFNHLSLLEEEICDA